MKEYLFIYLLQLSHIIQCTSVVLRGLSIITIIILIMTSAISGELENYQKTAIKIFTGLFIFGSFLSFVPTKETLLLIGGTYLGKKVVTTERMTKVNKIIDYKLADLIKKYEKDK